MGPAKLVMACRNETKGKEAVEGVINSLYMLNETNSPIALAEVKKATGLDAIELCIVDLSNFTSVREFADKYIKEIRKLDILVANAAMLAVKYEVTVDGWETS
jgi:retinol dehydrogenase 12